MDDEQVCRYRPLLFSLAYRLLGSVVEAEDVVQEAFLAWAAGGNRAAVGDEKAYLFRIVANKCADWLRLKARRREQYVGPFLPEPLVAGEGTPEDEAVLRESLHTAYLLLLDRLGPTERVVFVLREAFGLSYAEVAEITGKSPANCRQIFHRARAKMAQAGAVAAAAPPDAERLAAQFVRTVQRGDLQGLLALLSPDAIMLTDGGGQVRAALAPVQSAEQVARLLIAVVGRLDPDLAVELRTVNGLPGVVASVHGTVTHALSLAFSGDRIAGLYLVSNPEKLGHLGVAPR